MALGPGVNPQSSIPVRSLGNAAPGARLGLTQRRLNALLKGKINQFSLDARVNAATRAGLQVDLLVTAPKRVNERAAANV